MRLVLWLAVFGAAAVLVQVPLELALRDGLTLAVLWTAGLLALRTTRAFVWTRYGLTFLDAALIAGAVATLRGPLAPLLPDTGFAPALEGVVRTYVPAMLVFLALSGALRIDPRPAALAGVLSIAVYIYYAVRFEIPATEWGVLPLIVLSAALAVTMARVVRYVSLRALEHEALADYIPEGASRELTMTGTLERTGRVEEVTLLLCDIRGFTRLSESLSPSETVTMVNAYLDAVCPPIASAGGVIDKFMGDGVLAFFEGGGNASRAVNAARRVLDAAARLDLGGAPVRIGIALHSGPVLVGTVGPRTRREYTIISDAVNTVTRLEELNKAYGSLVVASSATIGAVDESEREGFEGPLEVAIRGRGAGISVYVLGASTPLGDEQDLGDRLRRFVGGEDD